jgi:hypothetical protein
MIQTYDCYKNIKVIVWVAFWGTGRTSFYIIDRDFESKKHKYSIASYLKVLETQVLGWYRILGKSYIFMQDNASIYTTRKIKDWFGENRITTTD